MPEGTEVRLREDLVRLVYRSMPVGLVATVTNSLIVAALHRRFVPDWILFSWWFALLLISILRSILLFSYRRSSEEVRRQPVWGHLLVVSTSVSGIVWGFCGLFMLFHSSEPRYVLVAFVLGGMTAGAASILSPIPALYFGFVLPMLLPQLISFFSSMDPLQIGMGAMLTLFGVLISIVASTNRRLIQSTFRLGYEREELIRSLLREKEETLQTIRRLREEMALREQLEGQLRVAHGELEKTVEERTRELRESNRKLTEANTELAQFTHSVSHDLRAPLRGIDGFAAALQEDYQNVLDETGRQYLAFVRNGTKRMQEIIQDLLELSRVTQGGLERKVVDLSALVEEIVADLRRGDPGRIVTTEITQGLKASGDARLIRIALENLVGNAWKYTRKVPHARIQFGSMHEGEKTVFFVKDNGAGFDMAFADRLFRPFQRLHSSNEFPGTGVGLATVLRVIRRHGGEVWARSAPGEGATFFFTFG